MPTSLAMHEAEKPKKVGQTFNEPSQSSDNLADLNRFINQQIDGVELGIKGMNEQ